MKKLLIVLAVLFLPLAAFASASNVVLTPQGTLYTIDSVDVHGMEGTPTDAGLALQLTVHTADDTQTMLVPGTTAGGDHFNASLAYDDTTDTLFVFWVHMPNPMSTELLLSSYHQGFWTEPASIDNAVFHYRTNLRIAVTHWATETNDDGTTTPVSALAVHAIWWDESGTGESARYALISLQDGSVASIETHYLNDFIDSSTNPATPVVLDSTFNTDLFRHPAIFARPGNDGVEVVFGNLTTSQFHDIELRPIYVHGVLEVPIGFHGGVAFGPPAAFAAKSTTGIDTMRGDNPGDLVFYFKDDSGNLEFIRHHQGTWSDIKSIALGDSLSFDTAVGALERLTRGN